MAKGCRAFPAVGSLLLVPGRLLIVLLSDRSCSFQLLRRRRVAVRYHPGAENPWTYDDGMPGNVTTRESKQPRVGVRSPTAVLSIGSCEPCPWPV